jgi:hypothetical protein
LCASFKSGGRAILAQCLAIHNGTTRMSSKVLEFQVNNNVTCLWVGVVTTLRPKTMINHYLAIISWRKARGPKMDFKIISLVSPF